MKSKFSQIKEELEEKFHNESAKSKEAFQRISQLEMELVKRKAEVDNQHDLRIIAEKQIEGTYFIKIFIINKL